VLAALLVAVAVAGLAGMVALRVNVRAQLKATADSGGIWRAAAGGAWGPLAFTAGLSPAGTAWTAHVLGRVVARGTRLPRVPAAARIAPLRAFALVRRALRRVRFDRVDARVHGAAGDPATSAQLLGFIAAAGAVIAPRAHIVSDVDWLADAPFLNVDCALEASFVPAALGWDVMRARLGAFARVNQAKRDARTGP
jgi:hypothetical protein